MNKITMGVAGLACSACAKVALKHYRVQKLPLDPKAVYKVNVEASSGTSQRKSTAKVPFRFFFCTNTSHIHYVP